MVVLYKACPFNGFIEIRIVSHVDVTESQSVGCLTELIGIQHLHTLIYRFKADITIVGDMELLVLSSLCRNLNNTGSTT